MRRIVVSSTLLAALALTVWVSVRPGHAQSKPKAAKAAAAAPASYGNVDSISEEEMKIYLYFLASDQLEGRNLPSRGLDTAALYIASHLAEWGLKPGGSTTKTTGPLQPYFMPMELVSKSVLPEQSKASITAPAAAGGRGGRGGGGAVAERAAERRLRDSADHGFRVHQGLERRAAEAADAPPLEALDVTGESGVCRQRLRHQQDEDQSVRRPGREGQDRRGGRTACRTGGAAGGAGAGGGDAARRRRSRRHGCAGAAPAAANGPGQRRRIRWARPVRIF